MGDAWDEIVAKAGMAPSKPSYGAANGKAKPASSFTANLSNPRVAGALSAALESARANIVTGQSTGLGRNNQLNAEAANLYSLAVGNNLMPENELRDWLYDVAREAGLEHDENCGPKQIDDTIASGFKAGKHKYGPRDLSHLKDTINVEVVEDLPPVGVANWQPVKETRSTDLHDQIIGLENGFWEARESLQHIYTAALSRLCGPWSVLANVAARALTTVRPNVTLPNLIGHGTLNWYAVVAAPPGGSKGGSSAVARDLLKGVAIDIRNLGSGEGICKQFYKEGRKGEPPIIHEAIMFEATEIDTLAALKDRSGQTTMGVLRSGFSGETLGFSYSNNNDHHIDAGTYRMTLVLSVQPGRARALFDDSGGGTPQRFQWFPASDRRVSRNRPYWPGDLLIPNWTTWQYPRELTIPKVAEDMIVDAAVARNRGEVGALDGHSLFVREKFAYALTVLDNRTEMTEEDWELAGIASEVSTTTRDWVARELEQIEIMDAENTGVTYGRRTAAAKASEAAYSASRTEMTKHWVYRHLAERGPRSNRELKDAAGSRYRTWLAAALNSLKGDGLIEKNKDLRWEIS